MFKRKKLDEENRYYLLPAMQHGARRKHYQRLAWALVVGVIFSALTATLLYLMNHR